MNRGLLFCRARGMVKAGLLLLLALSISSYLVACGGTSASSGPVTLTFWSWVPNLQQAIDLFEKSHPNIKIKWQNVGSGGTEYTKLTTALKAGSGAPDVVQIEYAYLPQYILSGKLVDLSQYGANDVKDQFVPWTWAQVSSGGKVYAIPQDTGPMGLLYREDIFKKYNLPVPTTWDQYAQEAIQLHKANPKIYITDFSASDGPWFFSLLWQAGSQPFVVNGTTIKIHLDDAAALKVANYWGNLVKSGAVSTAADWNNDWYAALQNGTLATWITAAWAPSDLEGFAPKSVGLWRAAPLPQWSAGEQVSANWGGSTDAVTTQCQHPAEAAEFVKWLNTNPESVKILTQKLYLFPSQKSALQDPSFDTANSFYGGQQVNRIFVESAQQVNTSFQWSPFQDYVFSQLQNQLATAVNGKISFEQAMHNTQNAVVTYARSQGFTVIS
ncbi:MAG: sugar ABC transporter substrate-binding protein [Thermogemmatispora sp.]|uniref:ABC transporter substrate-binding protein n=1 Tax=Thermogemmatispora sp. TaxID=1968838 RepID=UPI002607D5D0|nr:sugar ABC transporter substrate-binding protein [Thermogemmatispora sp.]MBX5457916.1 sugar ABC transporter substrate-binding protein [Thermogemmatispora sp.]